MSDAWKDMREFKSRQSSLRERLQRRKKERQEIVQSISMEPVTSAGEDSSGPGSSMLNQPVVSPQAGHQSSATQGISTDTAAADPIDVDEVERRLLRCLLDVALDLPADSRRLQTIVSRSYGRDVDHDTLEDLLHKLAAQELITLHEDITAEGTPCLQVVSTEHTRLQAFVDAQDEESEMSEKRGQKRTAPDPIESLLSLPSAREKETKQLSEEILELLSRPTAKERSLVERFRSQGGAQVQEFCPHGTKQECSRSSSTGSACGKLHFNKIIQKHTDESLGDCSFLNTCFHMDSCKYVHYEVDSSAPVSRPPQTPASSSSPPALLRGTGPTVLHPPQWIQCDLRYFDMSILGKFSVVMADPPWDIHMELPYGTMSDDEMRQLNVPSLTDDGLIFLWVTGRAMELGRECLKLWGYERCDELIWVKTNQLQRIIRTGRTGHWLNHGKEHCLVGVKGNPKEINRGLDCDVIVAEVRATSHKPDEIYGIIERLSPGTRKIELFGRPHNVQPNWITLGNQVEGVRLTDPVLINEFRKLYPDGDCMKKPQAPPPMAVNAWAADAHLNRPMMDSMVGYREPMGVPEPGIMYEGIPASVYHHYPPPPVVTPIPRQ
uniref:mRNA m(6)A methyltransferase n=1 Tax=Amblyomma triste TaxID=251400 RepID=A0A023GFK5_AMBTT